MNAIQAKRCLKLADHLDTVERRLFNILYFELDDDCGTVCCAAGHAAKLKSFNRSGFRLDAAIPVFREHTGFHAIREFFGEEAESLFFKDAYDCTPKKVTPTMVAERLREVVREYS